MAKRCLSWMILRQAGKRVARLRCDLFVPHRTDHVYVWNNAGGLVITVRWQRPTAIRGTDG